MVYAAANYQKELSSLSQYICILGFWGEVRLDEVNV